MSTIRSSDSVSPFGERGRTRRSVLALGTALSLLAFVPTARAEPLPIMVVDFTSSVGTNWSRRLPELIVDELVNSGDFDVLEREKLDSVAEELAFQAGALVDPSKAVQIGGMSGAALMVTGNIIENRSSSKRSTSYNITSTIVDHYLKARMEVVDLTSGSKLFSHVADDSATLKTTGPNTVGEGEESLGPAVASQLVAAMLEHERIRSMIEAAGGGSPAEPITITIGSVPEGADVEIDGVYFGNAGGPFDVTPGVHEIVVTLPGHESWVKQVKVRDG